MSIGVLALQGDFAKHIEAIHRLDAEARAIKRSQELADISGLILPGGESTTMLRLLNEEFRHAIAEFLASGKPVLATCAGIILLAKSVTHPQQFSFGALDISVERNGFGRQIDSFRTKDIKLTPEGRSVFAEIESPNLSRDGVFIRAPRITAVGTNVQVLATYKDEPVVVGNKSILGLTFHPELDAVPSQYHAVFLARAKSWKAEKLTDLAERDVR